jgi:hypothetical protein
MDHHNPSKRIKRLLREHATTAHEEELRRALVPLAAAFDRWSRDEINSFELSNLIHDFHQGPSRDLFARYTTRPHDLPVAYAIVSGIINRGDVPPELLEHLAAAITFSTDVRTDEDAPSGARVRELVRHDAPGAPGPR